MANRKVSEYERHFATGKAYRHCMRYDLAEAELTKALKKAPKSPKILLELGLCCQGQGDASRACEHFEKAVELSPKFIRAHEALAHHYQQEGNTEKHLAHLEEMSKINPRNVERNVAIGTSLVKCGRKEDAKKILMKTMELAGGQFSDVAEKIGEVFLGMGADDMAEETFNKALLVNPKSMLSFNKLGILYRRQKKYKEAISTYFKAIGMSPNSESLYHNLAIAYYESGALEKAVQALGQSLKINPGFEQAIKLRKTYLGMLKKG